MPTKRSLLEQLTRSELQALVERARSPVQDRRVREQLIEALMTSRKLALATLLADYSRDRLKELCRALGLEDSGKEKRLLVERLLGAKARGSGAYAVAPGSPAVVAAREPAAVFSART